MRKKPTTVGCNDIIGLGDGLTYLPTLAQNPDNTAVFNASKKGARMSELCWGICKTQLVLNSPSEKDYRDLYADMSKHQLFDNAYESNLKVYGYSTNNCIPKLQFFDFDFVKVGELVKRFKNPVIISPVVRDWDKKDNIAQQHRMFPMKLWQNIIDMLFHAGHTPIYIISPEVTPHFKNCKYVDNLGLRESAAFMYLVDKVITLDTGLHHLAIASGAKTYVLLALETRGYHWSNWCFIDDKFWTNEPRRAFYFDFENYPSLVNKFL